jgi:hypothetical protein
MRVEVHERRIGLVVRLPVVIVELLVLLPGAIDGEAHVRSPLVCVTAEREELHVLLDLALGLRFRGTTWRQVDVRGVGREELRGLPLTVGRLNADVEHGLARGRGGGGVDPVGLDHEHALLLDAERDPFRNLELRGGVAAAREESRVRHVGVGADVAVAEPRLRAHHLHEDGVMSELALEAARLDDVDLAVERVRDVRAPRNVGPGRDLGDERRHHAHLVRSRRRRMEALEERDVVGRRRGRALVRAAPQQSDERAGRESGERSVGAHDRAPLHFARRAMHAAGTHALPRASV